MAVEKMAGQEKQNTLWEMQREVRGMVWKIRDLLIEHSTEKAQEQVHSDQLDLMISYENGTYGLLVEIQETILKLGKE